MDDQRMRKCVAWYDEVYEDHRRLVETVVGILTTAAGAHALEYLSIAGRVKTRQSFLNKVRSKGYRQPELQVTDLSGVRVITYVESAAEKAASLVRQTLDVVDEHSLDKSRALGADRVGYRSLHFVCRLGGQRTQLAEYAAFGDLVFEIQVRTVLQHAWAEIEHDRNYKLAGSLPPPLERRINLLAGLLEIADRHWADAPG